MRLTIQRHGETVGTTELTPGVRVVVGRGKAADRRLDDPHVSRKHLALTPTDAGTVILEVLSPKGVFVGADKLTETTTLSLPAAIRLGEHQLELRAAGSLGVWELYEKQRLLGEGGYGKVFAARRRADGLEVAIKVVPLENADMRDRLERECRLCTKLDDVHLVRLYEAHFEGEQAFQVMELVEAEDLAERLRQGPLALSEVERLARGMAQALRVLHEAGVIHRDIKPANVMLLGDGSVKITDFGLARLTESGETLTKTHTGMGTLAYVAPEQIENAKRATETADLYSLGATLYHALTGSAPFASLPLFDLVDQLAELEPDPLREARPDCPEAMIKVVERLMSKLPEARYPSAKLLLKRLDKAFSAR